MRMASQLLRTSSWSERDFASPATCPAGWGSVHENDIVMLKNMKKKSPSVLRGQLHVANCNIRVKTVGFVVNCQMLKTTVLETLAQHGSPRT